MPAAVLSLHSAGIHDRIQVQIGIREGASRMRELLQDPFYALMETYDRCVIDYCLIEDDTPYLGYRSHKDAVLFSVSAGREKLYFTLAAVILLANFFGWLLYFSGHQSFFVMMLFLVAMPPLYYVAIGFWRQNTPLTVAGALFFVIHFFHVLGHLRGR